MLKKVAVAGAVLSCAPGLVSAADLPVRYQRPLNAVAPVPFTWTGFYIGANVGGAFDNEDRVNVSGIGALLGSGIDAYSLRNKSTGVTAGGQAGYNYEFDLGNGGGIVIGLEADAAFTDLSRNSVIDTSVILPGSSADYHTSLDYLGTIRGRLGYAYDRFFVYGTGGLAYGGVDHNVNLRSGAGASLASINFDTTEVGFTYGGGIEYALPIEPFYNIASSSAVTIRVEYLRYELNNTDATANIGAAEPLKIKFHDVGNIARAGINYKF
jgi:outer membrane immunogenic protein